MKAFEDLRQDETASLKDSKTKQSALETFFFICVCVSDRESPVVAGLKVLLRGTASLCLCIIMCVYGRKEEVNNKEANGSKRYSSFKLIHSPFLSLIILDCCLYDTFFKSYARCGIKKKNDVIKKNVLFSIVTIFSMSFRLSSVLQ